MELSMKRKENNNGHWLVSKFVPVATLIVTAFEDWLDPVGYGFMWFGEFLLDLGALILM